MIKPCSMINERQRARGSVQDASLGACEEAASLAMWKAM
jgi:hypothetical protein